MALSESKAIFDLIPQPVFTLQNGAVDYANPAADALGIRAGLTLHQFLYAAYYPIPGKQIEHFECALHGVSYRAACTLQDGRALYLLERQEPAAETGFSGQTLAHTAAVIRQSIHEMQFSLSRLSDELTRAENEETLKYAAIALRGVFRLERTADNLDCLQRLRSDAFAPRFASLDLTQLFTALFSEAAELLRLAEIQLDFDIAPMLQGVSDKKLLSVIFWNLLSNAAADCGESKKIRAWLKKKDPSVLELCIENRPAESPLLQSGLFARHSADMNEHLNQQGLGLGLSLISGAAQALGGGLMLSQAGKDTVRALVQINVAPRPEHLLRSDVLTPESGLDEGLVGLSPVLPCEAFDLRDLL